MFCHQHAGAHSYELIMFLKVVSKRECRFHCYKLCSSTQAWDECVVSGNTVQTCVRVESMQ
jgi:hypothetical protein